MKKQHVYLDNCCFNRPYDNQEQLTIRLESEAKLAIQERVKKGRHFIFENRERFDYTKWRENLFENMSVEEIIKEGQQFAVDFRKIKGEI